MWATFLTRKFNIRPHLGQNPKRKGYIVVIFSQEHWGPWKYCDCDKEGKYCACYKWIDKFVNIYHGRKSWDFSSSVTLLTVGCLFMGWKRSFPLISKRIAQDNLKYFGGKFFFFGSTASTFVVPSKAQNGHCESKSAIISSNKHCVSPSPRFSQLWLD